MRWAWAGSRRSTSIFSSWVPPTGSKLVESMIWRWPGFPPSRAETSRAMLGESPMWAYERTTAWLAPSELNVGFLDCLTTSSALRAR
jgi:hypothetical protein